MNNSLLRLAGRLPRLAVVSLVFALSGLSIFAQSAATGMISGRVYNPATKEFVRDAEVRVERTSLLTATGDGGYYAFANVPVGQATVSVSYTGYEKSTQLVRLPPAKSPRATSNSPLREHRKLAPTTARSSSRRSWSPRRSRATRSKS